MIGLKILKEMILQTVSKLTENEALIADIVGTLVFFAFMIFVMVS